MLKNGVFECLNWNKYEKLNVTRKLEYYTVEENTILSDKKFMPKQQLFF